MNSEEEQVQKVRVGSIPEPSHEDVMSAQEIIHIS
jgi:hypothetical protein